MDIPVHIWCKSNYTPSGPSKGRFHKEIFTSNGSAKRCGKHQRHFERCFVATWDICGRVGASFCLFVLCTQRLAKFEDVQRWHGIFRFHHFTREFFGGWLYNPMLCPLGHLGDPKLRTSSELLKQYIYSCRELSLHFAPTQNLKRSFSTVDGRNLAPPWMFKTM